MFTEFFNGDDGDEEGGLYLIEDFNDAGRDVAVRGVGVVDLVAEGFVVPMLDWDEEEEEEEEERELLCIAA